MTDDVYYVVIFKDRSVHRRQSLKGPIEDVLTAENIHFVEFFQRLEGNPQDTDANAAH